MLARDFVSETVPALKTSDSGMDALYWMDIFRISHLPIVNNNEFLGLISDKDIYDLNMAEEPIGNHDLSLIRPYVYIDQHIFDILGLAADLHLTVIPVLDNDKKYHGVITQEDLISYFGKLSSLDQPGGLLVLEMSENDYSLSQIAQIAESNNIKILSFYIHQKENSTKLDVVMKLNTTDLTSLIKTFERYDYTIKASYTEDENMDALFENRYEEFLRFLNI
jgi:CBS domain-containing protein